MYVWRHLKTVCRHKSVVFRECCACGLIWRGLMHDMSKFSLPEFLPSAKYFQGNRSPIEAEKAEKGYSAAWQHHKGHNPHHWEYWVEYDANSVVIPLKIPFPFVVEMVCDWIGAGKVYSADNWTQNAPLEHYNRMRKERHFHPETEQLIVLLLECIRDRGLKAFHRMARCQGEWAYLRKDYEEV